MLTRFENGLLIQFKRWRWNGYAQLEGRFSGAHAYDLQKLFEIEERKMKLDPEALALGEEKPLRGEFDFDTESKKHGIWRQWHRNGEKMREIRYLHGRLDGLWTVWHSNGQLSRQQNFKDGVREGPWSMWYSQGSLKEDRRYAHGLPFGVWSKWHLSGQMLEKTLYADGVRNGVFSEWHENGRVAKKGKYASGKLNGKWLTWYANGNKQTERFYENDNLISANSWTPDGVQLEDEVLEGNGTLLFYDLNGTERYKQDYRYGQKSMNSWSPCR